jgi:adenine-specific DNA glycosylase
VALRQRPDTGLLASLYEPFSFHGKLTAAEVAERLAALGIRPLRIAPLGEGKHIFTHLEWHMVGFEVDLDEKSAETVRENADLGLFFAPSYEIDDAYAVPSAYSVYRAFM